MAASKDRFVGNFEDDFELVDDEDVEKGGEDEARDADGKWTTGGGGGASAKPADEHPFAARSASAKEFKTAFDKAFENSPFSAYVTHYSEEQLSGMKMFLSEDGKAGQAVHDHGDGRIEATALFNQGAPKGTGRKLLLHAVAHAGVNYLECYGEGLRKLYESAGFKVESSSPFNPEYAAPGWDYEKLGRPNYYTLRIGK